MNRTWPIGAFIGCLAFSGALSRLPGQTPGAGIEQQIRAPYQIASVGSNGVIVRPGSILVVAQDGIKANPPSGDIYWYNSHKPGNRIKYSIIFEAAPIAGSLKDQIRLLQVGEKAVLTRLEIRPKSSEVDFYVQTSVDSPYRAWVVFQFPKGYLESANLKGIQDSIAEVFALDTSSPTEESSTTRRRKASIPPGDGAQLPPVTMSLPATYVNSQVQTDQLQLNADHSFSLQEAGQPYRGHFEVNGKTLEINITDGPATTMTLDGSSLKDSSQQTWVRQEQGSKPAPSAGVLQNQDIIKLVKASIDDAIIIAKIGGSKCQFDTSPDALIQLKTSGVSGAVLSAMLGAGK